MLAAPPERAAGLLAQVSNARAAWRAAPLVTADAFTEAATAAIRLRKLDIESPLPVAGRG